MVTHALLFSKVARQSNEAVEILMGIDLRFHDPFYSRDDLNNGHKQPCTNPC